MPLYFFHICRPDDAPALDEEGAEFADYQAARQEAVLSMREIAADAVRCGGKVTGLAIEIGDQSGKMLGSVCAREVFD